MGGTIWHLSMPYILYVLGLFPQPSLKTQAGTSTVKQNLDVSTIHVSILNNIGDGNYPQ